jgi:hypothetical protein
LSGTRRGELRPRSTTSPRSTGCICQARRSGSSTRIPRTRRWHRLARVRANSKQGRNQPTPSTRVNSMSCCGLDQLPSAPMCPTRPSATSVTSRGCGWCDGSPQTPSCEFGVLPATLLTRRMAVRPRGGVVQSQSVTPRSAGGQGGGHLPASVRSPVAVAEGPLLLRGSRGAEGEY